MSDPTFYPGDKVLVNMPFHTKAPKIPDDVMREWRLNDGPLPEFWIEAKVREVRRNFDLTPLYDVAGVDFFSLVRADSLRLVERALEANKP